MNRRRFLQGTAAMAAAPSLAARAQERLYGDDLSYEQLKPAEVVREDWRSYVPASAPKRLPSPQKEYEFSVPQSLWRERLPADRYDVLFENVTEPKYSSDLVDVTQPGVFVCAACELPLFTTAMKFHSHTGWPSFYTYIPRTLGFQWDFAIILPRKEYHCARCGGHQGHVFDGWPTPTGLRYCNNGLAVQFLPADGSAA